MDQGGSSQQIASTRPLVGRIVAWARQRAGIRIHHMFTSRSPGFRRLAEAHAGAVAGDTLVAMALAGTLFFDVPSTEARDNVALYLLITLAPFAVIGPFLGAVYERFPGAYRRGLVLSAVLRAAIALVMVVGRDGFLLFPLAFVMLVLSRLFGITRSSLLPVVVAGPRDLIAANAPGGSHWSLRQRGRRSDRRHRFLGPRLLVCPGCCRRRVRLVGCESLTVTDH